MTYQVAWNIPFGELCDLIAIEQVKNEGAKLKKTKSEEEADFWRLMGFE